MNVSTANQFTASAVVPSVSSNNVSDIPEGKTPSGVSVSISPAAREQYDADVKHAESTGKPSTENKDLGESLRAENSVLNSSKTEKESLSLAEKLEQRIEEIKEKIKEAQKEIIALKADGNEESKDKAKVIEQQMQALLTELMSLMEQQLE